VGITGLRNDVAITLPKELTTKAEVMPIVAVWRAETTCCVLT